jgi:hypothetical protein
MSAPLTIPVTAAMRAALEKASREVQAAQQAAEAAMREQAALVAGAVLNSADVALDRVARWELTDDGITLTLAEPRPDAE